VARHAAVEAAEIDRDDLLDLHRRTPHLAGLGLEVRSDWIN
jgi:hypothetical protein